MKHLFEFMDMDFIPNSLRCVLREILDVGNSMPFRSYYRWVARHTLEIANENDIDTVYELGAGTGPISRHVWRLPEFHNSAVVMRPCDINPDLHHYRELQTGSSGKIVPIFESVDFTKPSSWKIKGARAAAVFSANLHHLPNAQRASVLQNCLFSFDVVIVAEPLHRSFSSVFFVALSVVPAILLPLLLIERSNRFPRFFWCWLVPLAPILFCWDGVVSALRQWSKKERDQQLFEGLGLSVHEVKIERRFFSEMIVIAPKAPVSKRASHA